jgi:hypothetical protein
MARILIYQPLSYLEGYVQFDLSWLFLFDHVSNLFSPLAPAIRCDDFFKASQLLKKGGLLSDSSEVLSSEEMDHLYTVPKSGALNIEEFSPAAPSRRFKKLLDAKHPKDSHSIYYASNGQFESDYTEGMTPLLKIAVNKFPIIDVGSMNIGELIDFLREPNTMEKKQAFCTVLDDIESWILNGEIHVRDVPDIIASRYADYLHRIGLLKKNYIEKSIELVMTVSENLLAGLSGVKISPAIQKLLSVGNKERNLPNRELAYIDHINGHFNKTPLPLAKPRFICAF